MIKRFTRILALFALLSMAAGQDGIWQQIDDEDDRQDFDAVYALLASLESDYGQDARYLWRMARHHFNVSDNTTDEAVIAENLTTGLKLAGEAVAADSTSADAHGYYGILIGRVGEIEGTKQKILNSYQVRDHTIRAIALDADNAAWPHVMGRWHYALSDLSWLERGIASLVYASPPEASFEEARSYFQVAADKAPEEIRHFLWLGKTLLELDKDAAVRTSLEQALALPASSDSDRNLQAEARQLLDDL
jgi:hypothetical protein